MAPAQTTTRVRQGAMGPSPNKIEQ